jgi:cytochrome b
MTSNTRIWDLPIRVFHWSLVGLFAFSWWSAENHQLDWHRLSGYTLLALLLFRLVWGVIGSSTARFSHFVVRPAAALAYGRQFLQRPGPHWDGHNPMGGWSVVALLTLLGVQVTTGLFSVDTDGLESGPLARFVSFGVGRALAEVHEISFNLLLALTGLHIGAVLLYRFYKKQDLTKPMLTGHAEHPLTASLRFESTAKAVVVLVFCAIVAALIASV